jgi:hypothetical protein
MYHSTPATVKLPGRRAIRDRVMDMHSDMTESFKAMFQVLKWFLVCSSFVHLRVQEVTSNFAVSLDAWTSSNGYAFMAIIVH